MAHGILFDTNVIIGVLNGTLSPAALEKYRRVFISAVTVTELYALAGMSREEEARINYSLSFLAVVPVSFGIARKAGILARTRRRGKPDLLIAATAIELNVPILTYNLRDFRDIPDLIVQSVA